MFDFLFGNKNLKTLDIEPTKLDDNTTYICKVHNHKGEPVPEKNVEISGKELKILNDIHGMKKGMIMYSDELLYDVVEEEGDN